MHMHHHNYNQHGVVLCMGVCVRFELHTLQKAQSTNKYPWYLLLLSFSLLQPQQRDGDARLRSNEH